MNKLTDKHIIIAVALLWAAGAIAAVLLIIGSGGSNSVIAVTHDDADADAFAYLEVAPKDQLFLVEMANFAFTPKVLEVRAGDVLEIAIQNVEPLLHDFTIDEVTADVHISYLGGTGQHAHEESAKSADVHFALTQPGSGIVHLKIDEPGDYVFYCTVPGHQEAGMEGTLTVLAD